MVGEDSVTVCHITGACSYDGAGDVLMLDVSLDTC